MRKGVASCGSGDVNDPILYGEWGFLPDMLRCCFAVFDLVDLACTTYVELMSVAPKCWNGLAAAVRWI
jgi:hypothetical protein